MTLTDSQPTKAMIHRSTPIVVGGLALLTLAASGLLVATLQVILLIFGGALFGLFLNSLAHALADHSLLPYRAAYAVVVLLFIAVMGGISYYSGFQIGQQVVRFAEEMRTATEQLNRRFEGSVWGEQYPHMLVRLRESLADGPGIFSQITRATGSLVWTATAMVVIFFVGLYVAYDPHLYQRGIVQLLPNHYRPRAREVMARLRATLTRWIVGRLISMSIVGAATSVALWLLGVPLPISLGVVAALLTFIPNIGPILAAIPQALVAFQLGSSTVMHVLLFNVALQTLESYVITPVVQQYEVTLPPALTISSQLLMAVLAGAIGIVMAAPLTAVMLVLFQMLHADRQGGDEQPDRTDGHGQEETGSNDSRDQEDGENRASQMGDGSSTSHGERQSSRSDD